MKYKSVFIPAVAAKVSDSSAFSGSEKQDSDAYIDGYDLAGQCERQCNELAAAGYEVVSITETTRGNWGGWDNRGAGWSMTMGLIITARRS